MSINAGRGHPWPRQLPSGWASSPYGRREPITSIPVEPEVVVEALADVSMEHSRSAPGSPR